MLLAEMASWHHWLGIAGLACALQHQAAAKQRENKEASAAFYSNAVVYSLRIEITPEDMAKLRKDPRKFISATVKEGETRYTDVGLHLKGAAGSFRGIDDPRPGFTLSFSKYESKRKFHGGRKIHLNNAVQDASYLNENLAGELFRAAGVPAARVTYAMVQLNDRKLGLYVLKEGITEDFLAMYFKNPHGNVYDMEGGREVTEPMKRESGNGPADWSDLKALAAAAQEPDLAKRWEHLNQVLDVDRFISFMAMEAITGHWDGYCNSRNNFRIYHDMDTDRMVFLPHGMDQMFTDPNYPLQRPTYNGLVAQAIIKTPQGRHRYRERLRGLIPAVFKVEALTNRVNELAAQIRPALAVYDTNAAREFDGQAATVRTRLVQRGATLEKFLHSPEPKPIVFDSGVARVTGWRISDDHAGANLEQTKETAGQQVLRIQATTNTHASWRANVLLEEGRYRLEGRARTTGVVPLKDDKKGEGAGLRISGSQQPRGNKLTGDNDWQTLAYEFDAAAPDDEVDLVCELRATEGEVWFDINSLRLVRIR